jgi:hypothetical protein
MEILGTFSTNLFVMAVKGNTVKIRTAQGRSRELIRVVDQHFIALSVRNR